MRIKCIIFDFDGTLFDSMFIWDDAGEKYLRSLGRKPKPSMREDLQALSLYQAACYFKEEYDLALSVDEVMEGISQTVGDFYIHEAKPREGVRRFLEEVKQSGIFMCIATANERSLVEAALKRCGIEHFFDAVFTCTEVECGKDEPVIFRRAMEYFHADRSSTIIFEDAYHAVWTAKADGFMVAAVYDESEKRQNEIRQLCDCYLTDFKHVEHFWKFAAEKEEMNEDSINDCRN